MRTVYNLDGLNEGFGLKFLEGERLRQKTPDEGKRVQGWNVVDIATKNMTTV